MIPAAAAAAFCFLGSSARPEQNSPRDDFLFLFLNPSVPQNRFTMEPQIRLAEAAGIAKFSFRSGGALANPGQKAGEWKKADETLKICRRHGDRRMSASRRRRSPPTKNGASRWVPRRRENG